jgi:D-alanine-D-alanine ligase
VKRELALIAYGDVPPDAPEDEQDVLVEVSCVAGALEVLGYRTERLPVTLDLAAMVGRIRAAKPAFVFNLVESIAGHDSLQHLAPSVFDTLGVSYTGADARAVSLTTDKHLAKRIFQSAGIPTPAWKRLDETDEAGVAFAPPYIVKRVSEDASRGIDDTSVLRTEAELAAYVRGVAAEERCRVMVEQFVTGREFNISVVADRSGPQVLPPAEIVFQDYPDGKPTIVGYTAKWDKNSFEYSHTVRRFATGPEDRQLVSELSELCCSCWNVIGLRGYARVDFRVDESGRPWVLEVNANPCIAPDAGLAAAAGQAGMSFVELVGRIVDSAQAGM